MKRAAYWFRKAAEQNFTPAQDYLAALYEMGRGVPRDTREAAKWYRAAAEKDDAIAENGFRSPLELLRSE